MGWLCGIGEEGGGEREMPFRCWGLGFGLGLLGRKGRGISVTAVT